MRFEDSELDEFALRRGDVLICEGGEPGRAAVWDQRESDIYFQKAIHRARFSNRVDPHFFVNFLRASSDSDRLSTYFTGVGIKHFTGKGLASFLFPVPPLAEQHRIVAKVDELMALCDRLEAAQAERERRRDHLSAASLQRLNEPIDSVACREHADFHLRHFVRFTTRADQVPALRQTILNLAVRGKLVEQDPNDEPASVLLEQIQAEKAQLRKEGKIKKEHGAPLVDHVTAKLVPRGWQAVRASELLTFVTSGSRGWAAHYAKEGSIFLRIGNLDYGTTDLDLSDVQCVNPPKGAEGDRTLVQEGDILISITGDTGMVGLVPASLPAAYINQHIALARPSKRLCRRYLATLFTSPLALAEFKWSQRGMKNSLGLEDIRSVLVLIPPVTEQLRIVARVDELMALCDRLEAALLNRENVRGRLLEAVLQEVLAPAERERTSFKSQVSSLNGKKIGITVDAEDTEGQARHCARMGSKDDCGEYLRSDHAEP